MFLINIKKKAPDLQKLQMIIGNFSEHFKIAI